MHTHRYIYICICKYNNQNRFNTKNDSKYILLLSEVVPLLVLAPLLGNNLSSNFTVPRGRGKTRVL